MKKVSGLLIVLTFILSAIACQITGGPKPPRTLTITQEEAKAFEQALTNVKVNLVTGIITITFTESQLTSYVNYNLREEVSQYVTNPLIYFETNQIHIYGTFKTNSIQADGRIILDVSIINQAPKFTVVSADLGPLQVPSSLLKTITEQLDREVAAALSKNTTGYKLDSINLSTSKLVLTLKK